MTAVPKGRETVTIGIDLSMRSTGVSVVNKKGWLIDCLQHKTKKTDDEIHEQLLIDNVDAFISFIRRQQHKYNVKEVVIEGLSFGSSSALKDVIQGHMWHLRIELHKLPIAFRIVTPAHWRKKNTIRPKDKKIKEIKEELGTNYWKILAVNKLSTKTKNRMEKYVKKMNWNQLKYDRHLWDLADSYWVARS